ncbi:MAG: hypothetical protein GY930_01920 [bacterium]|nr:hypothetical protein [bacterium]
MTEPTTIDPLELFHEVFDTRVENYDKYEVNGDKARRLQSVVRDLAASVEEGRPPTPALPQDLPTRTWNWRCHKSIRIEITAQPGCEPYVDICNQGDLGYVDGSDKGHSLERIAAEFLAARDVWRELQDEYEAGQS